MRVESVWRVCRSGCGAGWAELGWAVPGGAVLRYMRACHFASPSHASAAVVLLSSGSWMRALLLG